MSKRKSSTYYRRGDLDDFGDNITREKMHESGLFYCKGKGNVYNGLVLSKIVSGVISINLLDENGEQMTVPWKVYYFGGDDEGKEIEIIKADGRKEFYVYSMQEKRFRKKESIFEYMARVYS